MKKSFTLLEVLISTLILAFVFVAISNVINSLKTTKDTLKSKIEDKSDYLIKALYYDILNASEVNITNDGPDFVKLKLHTSNSLYKIPKPYVLWVVNRGDLIRIESPTPITSDKDYYTLDNFAKNVKIFKIYKKDKKYLIVVNKKFFEFYKGWE